jgi:hypothetical protein
MRIAVGLMATLAGLDKFFNILADWSGYVSPAAAQLLPLSTDVFMGIVGVVEIAVGIGILTAVPVLGAYVASAWLLLVAVNLVIAGATALALGLEIDVEALPGGVREALTAGQVDLNDPAVTVELLRLNAVVGVRGQVSKTGQLTSVGITCALCHSSVDNSFTTGIGKRLDGWANTDLNVGAIVALSPALDAATKAEFNTWGPGKYDPRHHAFNGTTLLPLNSPSLPIVLPPIYGLKGVGFETFTGDGPISYWNSYVGVGQMGGEGQLQRSSDRSLHQPDTGSRHTKAAGLAGVSTESSNAGGFERQRLIALAPGDADVTSYPGISTARPVICPAFSLA